MTPLSWLAGATSLQESALAALILTIGGLFGLALAFSGYAGLLRMRHERRARRWEALTAIWEEPVLAALSDPSRAGDVHALIDPGYRLHFVNFVLQYARRVRGVERETLRLMAVPYLAPLVARARSRHAEIRTRAVQTLGTLGLPRYSAEVISALDDKSPLVAMVAARALAREEFSEHAGSLLGRLNRFEQWSRRFLASMVAAIGLHAAPVLRSVLQDEDELPWVRSVAADALTMLADLESGDEAARIVGAEDDRELLAAALRLLTAVGRPEHAGVVRTRCAAPDYVIRAHALQALGNLSGDEADVFRLIRAMADPSPWVAIHAARGIRAAGGAKVLADLAESDDPRAVLAGHVLSEEKDTGGDEDTEGEVDRATGDVEEDGVGDGFWAEGKGQER